MRTAAICPTCATYINALCVIYDGPGLTNINVAPLDNLDDILQSINDNLVPRYGAGAPTNSAVYEGQIYINTATGDVYIATATGGGPADWVQLAYQSAIPATPSLDDVLLVGNTSTTSVVIQDLLVAPTQTNTMMSDGNELSDTTQGFITNYHINDIYVTDTVTGDFLQIAIDNTQNQTITFPDTSGQLALLSDTQLSLQNVTDNGNLTTNIIVADSFSSTPTYLSNFASLVGYVGNGTTAHGAISLREDSDGTGFSSTITADIDLTADRTISIPDADGTMVLSVNGNIPDNQGNVVVTGLPTSSDLQAVLTSGSSSTGIDMDIIDAVINVYDSGTTNNISLNGSTGELGIKTGNNTGFIKATNITSADRNIELPNNDGNLITSVTNQNLVVQDILAAPTQRVTVAPTNIFIQDTPLDLQTSYNVNNIIAEDVSTGDQLQINTDNFQNQVIDFPNYTGKLALQPTLIGRINLSAGSVTANGQKDGFYTVEVGESGSGGTVVLNKTQWNDCVTVTFLDFIPFGFSVVGGSQLLGDLNVTAAGAYYVTYVATIDYFFISYSLF
jgi:hypothetical protein